MTPRAALLLLFVGFACARSGCAIEAAPHRGVPHKATADQLLADAENSVAILIQLVQPKNADAATLKLKLTDPRQQPFWSAVRKMERTLKDARAQLKAHDPRFFDTLNDTTQTMALLQGACARAGIAGPPPLKAVRALHNALSVLRSNYGREVKMVARGGELTLDEKQDFERLKALEQSLLERLKTLRTQVDPSAHLKLDVDRLSARLRKVVDAPLTAEAFRNALENVDVLEGEWKAMSYFVEPRYRDAWKAAGTAEAFKAMDKVQGQATAAGAPSWDELDQPADAVDTHTETTLTKVEIDAYDAWLEDSMTVLELAAYYDAIQEEFPEMTSDEIEEYMEFGAPPPRE